MKDEIWQTDAASWGMVGMIVLMNQLRFLHHPF